VFSIVQLLEARYDEALVDVVAAMLSHDAAARPTSTTALMKLEAIAHRLGGFSTAERVTSERSRGDSNRLLSSLGCAVSQLSSGGMLLEFVPAETDAGVLPASLASGGSPSPLPSARAVAGAAMSTAQVVAEASAAEPAAGTDMRAVPTPDAAASCGATPARSSGLPVSIVAEPAGEPETCVLARGSPLSRAACRGSEASPRRTACAKIPATPAAQAAPSENIAARTRGKLQTGVATAPTRKSGRSFVGGRDVAGGAALASRFFAVGSGVAAASASELDPEFFAARAALARLQITSTDSVGILNVSAPCALLNDPPLSVSELTALLATLQSDSRARRRVAEDVSALGPLLEWRGELLSALSSANAVGFYTAVVSGITGLRLGPDDVRPDALSADLSDALRSLTLPAGGSCSWLTERAALGDSIAATGGVAAADTDDNWRVLLLQASDSLRLLSSCTLLEGFRICPVCQHQLDNRIAKRHFGEGTGEPCCRSSKHYFAVLLVLLCWLQQVTYLL
jgi:hypothetical protein